MTRLAIAFGQAIQTDDPLLTHVTPEPRNIAGASVAEIRSIGVTAARAASCSRLDGVCARRVVDRADQRRARVDRKTPNAARHWTVDRGVCRDACDALAGRVPLGGSRASPRRWKCLGSRVATNVRAVAAVEGVRGHAFLGCFVAAGSRAGESYLPGAIQASRWLRRAPALSCESRALSLELAPGGGRRQ